jgi:hypothetical protein
MTTVPDWHSAEGRRFPQYTGPFLSWDEVQKICPGHLEVQRFLRLREGIRALAWYQRRSHTPCDLEVTPEWGLDSLYFRHACEEEYGRQLSELLENPENNLMGNHLVCFPNPWVPYCWPAPQTTCLVKYSNFPQMGTCPTRQGVAWRRIVPGACGTFPCVTGFLVPFQQV